MRDEDVASIEYANPTAGGVVPHPTERLRGNPQTPYLQDLLQAQVETG